MIPGIDPQRLLALADQVATAEEAEAGARRMARYHIRLVPAFQARARQALERRAAAEAVEEMPKPQPPVEPPKPPKALRVLPTPERQARWGRPAWERPEPPPRAITRTRPRWIDRAILHLVGEGATLTRLEEGLRAMGAAKMPRDIEASLGRLAQAGAIVQQGAVWVAIREMTA